MKRLMLYGLVLLGVNLLPGAEKVKPTAADPGRNRANEPFAKEHSLKKAAAFLDRVALDWTRERKCGTCHTNVPYLMARGVLKEQAANEKLVRSFFEQRATNWDRGKKGDKPRWDTEVVVTGVTLALHDAATTGKLHKLSKQALDRMWKVQQKTGAWEWLKCDWPPLEHDDYFGAVFAAVGVGHAPGGYAKSESARAGLAKLRGYLAKNKVPNLHHKAWLLWAAQKLDGLMTADEQKKTIKEITDLQKPDGGWSLVSLGDWESYDEFPNNPMAGSDGYGTALMVYVLRQAGVPTSNAAVKKGVAWLKANQRQSGRWFTASLNTDKAHYITHAGTAFAVLALKACE